MEYTDDQMLDFGDRYNAIVAAKHAIEDSQGQHAVFQRRLVWKCLAETIPNYEGVPEDVRAEFGFDFDGFVNGLGAGV